MMAGGRILLLPMARECFRGRKWRKMPMRRKALFRHSPDVTGWRSSLGRDPVCNFVVLGLRHDAPRHQFAGFGIGTPRDHPICFGRRHTRQAQQLLFCGSVQIKWPIAIPALAYSFRHSLGIALRFRRRFRGFLLQFLRALSLRATRECSRRKIARM